MFKDWIEYNEKLFLQARLNKFLSIMDILDTAEEMANEMDLTLELNWKIKGEGEV